MFVLWKFINLVSNSTKRLTNIKFSFEFRLPTRRISSCFFVILLKELFTYLKNIEFYFYDIGGHMVHF